MSEIYDATISGLKFEDFKPESPIFIVNLRTDNGAMYKKLASWHLRVDGEGNRVFDIDATGKDSLQVCTGTPYGKNVTAVNNPRRRHFEFDAECLPPEAWLTMLEGLCKTAEIDGLGQSTIVVETYIVAPRMNRTDRFLRRRTDISANGSTHTDFTADSDTAWINMSGVVNGQRCFINTSAAYGGANDEAFVPAKTYNQMTEFIEGVFGKGGGQVDITMCVGQITLMDKKPITSQDEALLTLNFFCDMVDAKANQVMLFEMPIHQAY